jgi:hypothetical protein
MIRTIRDFLVGLLPRNGHRNRNVKIKNYRHNRAWEIHHETYGATCVDDEFDCPNGIFVDERLIQSRTLAPTEFEYRHLDDWDPASIDLNPATGMPMLDDCVDVMGNPYGFDNTSDLCCLDMDL